MYEQLDFKHARTMNVANPNTADARDVISNTMVVSMYGMVLLVCVAYTIMVDEIFILFGVGGYKS
jgi:heme/copper-type cytochrome/quinol oxidase subunit 2